MSLNFSTLPSGVLIAPEPFKVDIPETALEDLAASLKLSKLPKSTFENTTANSYYGVTRSWLENTKSFWANEFDWHVTPYQNPKIAG